MMKIRMKNPIRHSIRDITVNVVNGNHNKNSHRHHHSILFLFSSMMMMILVVQVICLFVVVQHHQTTTRIRTPLFVVTAFQLSSQPSVFLKSNKNKRFFSLQQQQHRKQALVSPISAAAAASAFTRNQNFKFKSSSSLSFSTGHHDGNVNVCTNNDMMKTQQQYFHRRHNNNPENQHDHPSYLLSMSSNDNNMYDGDDDSSLSVTNRNRFSYEDMVRKLPSNEFIQAVERILNKQSNTNNGGVIVADVAVEAGISLQRAAQELTILATVTRGDIAVTNDGELIYRFPSKNIQSLLRSNSFQYQITNFTQSIWPGLFWFIRVSFGVTLIASLVAIFSAIFVITSSSNRDDNDNRREGNNGGGGGLFGMGGGGGYSFYWGPSPLDYFWYRPYGSYGIGYYDGTKDPEEMGFFESIFSYVFGDGNPNNTLPYKRLQLVSNMIRSNNGAVTAEQLAPFCAENVPSLSTSLTTTTSNTNPVGYVDENYVLPIVTALNGIPQVTDDGDIIYLFPDLQQTTTSTFPTSSTSSLLEKQRQQQEKSLLRRAGLKPNASAREIMQFLNYNNIRTRGILERDELIQILEDVLPPTTRNTKNDKDEEDEYDYDDPTVLIERPYQFTLAPGINKFLAGGLGLVNLGGVLYLGNLLGQYLNMYATASVSLPPTLQSITTLYPFLFGYAILYNTIPLVRNLYIQKENEKIRLRNQKRLEWKNQLVSTITNKNNYLYKKLQNAKKMQQTMKNLLKDDNDATKNGSKKNIIFDTRQSIESIKEQKEQNILEEFDQKLNKSVLPTTTKTQNSSITNNDKNEFQ